MKYLADILTFSRLALAVFLIVWGVVGGNVDVFIVMFALAELTDSFDGYCSRKWPFKNPPAYRKYAVAFDIAADMLLWFAAILFFALRINLVAGLIVMFGVAAVAGLIEIIVYRRFFGHPDNFAKGSLCDRNFPLAKKIIMARRWLYLATIALVICWALWVTSWPLIVKCVLYGVAVAVAVFLWCFLATRRKNISRDAIEIEKKLSSK
ncbi:MAG: hypothetical protein Q4A33_02710 [Candidatus Saccharibacteria bacterium]|nr:hypothetical protein [Candidatus Saccharibacteria bacterium]